MPFPNIDPVIFEIGPFALRWYSLAYIIGLIGGWKYMVMLTHRPQLWPQGAPAKETHIDDLMLWVTLGTIGGGRIGYVLFYSPAYFLDNPGQILAVWQGGMSFHGGMLGVILAVLIYAWRNKLAILSVGDMVAVTVPLGLLLGRLANFINGELWGRVTDAPWGIIFPTGGPLPRHPSQLYEAALEGALLLVVLNLLAWRFRAFARPGLLTGLFLLGYGTSRAFIEFFRQPDAHIGFLAGGITMGQILSLPMMVAGIGFIFWSVRSAKA